MVKTIKNIPVGESFTVTGDCIVEGGTSIDGTLEVNNGTLTIEPEATINGLLKITEGRLDINRATINGNINMRGNCDVRIEGSQINGGCKIESDFEDFKTVTLAEGNRFASQVPYEKKNRLSVTADHVVIEGTIDLPEWTWMNTKKIDAPDSDVPPHAEFLASYSITVRDIMADGKAHTTHKGPLLFRSLRKGGMAITFEGEMDGKQVAGEARCHVGRFETLSGTACVTASKSIIFQEGQKGVKIDGAVYTMGYGNMDEILMRSQPSAYDRPPGFEDVLYIPGPGGLDIREGDERVEIVHTGKTFARDAAERSRMCPHPTLDIECERLEGTHIRGVKTVAAKESITGSNIAVSDKVESPNIKKTEIRASVDVPSYFANDQGQPRPDPMSEQFLIVEANTILTSKIIGAAKVCAQEIRRGCKIVAGVVEAQSISRWSSVSLVNTVEGPDDFRKR